jgi:hypothetical protein
MYERYPKFDSRACRFIAFLQEWGGNNVFAVLQSAVLSGEFRRLPPCRRRVIAGATVWLVHGGAAPPGLKWKFEPEQRTRPHYWRRPGNW